MRAFTLGDRMRLYTRVDTVTGCHVWIGHTAKGGYAVVSVGKGQQRYAHRVAYELANGPIPAGLMVLHRCDRTNCVNPAHLFLGTAQDNMDDCAQKGRWRNQTKAGANYQPFHKGRRRRSTL